MKFSLTAVLVLFTFFASAQPTLTSAAAKEDFSIFRRALETTYPSLYRYADSLSITNYLNRQSDNIPDAPTSMDLYRVITRACASINDEHLIPTPPKWYYDSIKKAHHYFPFSLKLIDRRMYVLKGFQLPATFPVGSEIISINGRSVEEILGLLLPTIPSDGYGQTFNFRHLEDYSMTQNENLFDLNYPIFVEKADSFQITFIHPDHQQEINTITLKGLDFNRYQEFYRERRQWTAPLQFKQLAKDVAYLHVISFHRGHRDAFHQDFARLYDSIFAQLQKNKTKNLIVDLRNNEGGDDTGLLLLSYLLRKPYRLIDYLEEKFTGFPAVKQYLDNGDDLFFIDSLVYRTSSGLYRLKEKYTATSPLFTTQTPNRNHFTGKIYVLINGASGSMAAVVASFLKASGRAIFIGEESGGAMEGPTSMGYAQLTLPHSRIHVEIPLTKSVHLLRYEKGRGVAPDYFVTPNISSLIKGIDVELKFALKLINAN